MPRSIFAWAWLGIIAIGSISRPADGHPTLHRKNIRVQGIPFFFLTSVVDSPLVQGEIMLRPHRNLNFGFIFAVQDRTEELDGTNRIYDYSSKELGIRFDFVFNHNAFTDGWYLSNGIRFGYMESSERTRFNDGCVGTYKSKGLIHHNFGSFGYQWFFGNGYNTNVGLGYVIARPYRVDPEIDNPCEGTEIKTADHGSYDKIFADIGFGFSF